VDDAVGEAFDKVAKLLGLGWPGGPALEQLAAQGDPARFAFPRPMKGRPGCDFSFSGLKTAVAQEVGRHGEGALEAKLAADVAAGFQRAVVEVMADRATHAMAMSPDAKLLVVAGGVAANNAIRAALAKAAAARDTQFAAPPLRLCTDNAVMVAWAGLERLRSSPAQEPNEELAVAPRPR
jgi:N6-L-threonylcarbamoyladenine synthase